MEKRSKYLDFVKGIAIILVVLGHCIEFGSGRNYYAEGIFFNNIIFKFIYSFHMPLLMLISGYLFCFTLKKYTVSEILKSRFISLMVPICSFSLIDFIIQLCKSTEIIWSITLVKEYIKIVVFNLWFLWAIFLTSLVVLCVNKLFKDNVLVYVLGFCLSFFVPDDFNLVGYKFLYPFFVLGYLYNKYDIKNRIQSLNYKLILLVLGAAYIVLFMGYTRDAYIYTTGHYILRDNITKQFIIDMYRTIIGLLGSGLILEIVIIIYKRYYANSFINIVSIIGKCSLGVYTISEIIFKHILPQITYNLEGISYFLVVLEGSLIIVICLLCIFAASRNKILNFLFFGARKMIK